MKRICAILVVLLLVLAGTCLVGAERLGLINLGLSMGYYGEFNKAMAVLRKHENVEYLGWRGNKDLTLEEFSIDVRINQQWPVSFYDPDGKRFAETDGVFIQSRKNFGYGWFLTFGADGNLAPHFDGAMGDLDDLLDRFDEIVEYLQAIPDDVLHERHYAAMPRGDALYLSIEGLKPE